MADTGINWGAWAYVDYNTGTDIDGIDVNDEATLTSDEVSLDGIAACEIGVKWVEGNDGACDGDVYVYLLRYDGEASWQTISDAVDCVAVIDATQNTTRIVGFPIDPHMVGSFKLLVDNDSGQDGDLTISKRTGTIPAAS